MAEESIDRLKKSALPFNAGRLLISSFWKNFSGPIYIREDIVSLMDHYLRKGKNTILVGDPGTGKNACVEGLVLKWLSDAGYFEGEFLREDFSVSLPYQDILETSYSKIIEDCFYAGNIENKISLLFKNCAEERILIFFDDFHLSLIPITGSYEDNVFTYLVDSLPKDGSVILLGATTPEGYRFMNSRYPEKINKFLKIEIPETSPEETFQILKKIREPLEGKYGIRLPDETLRELIDQFGRFLFWRKFPGKAFEALDMVVNSTQKSFHKAKTVYPEKKVFLTPQDVRKALQEQVGLNPIIINRETPLSRDSVKNFFAERIFEQEEAIQEITDSILRFRLNATPPGKPVVSFLFAGPSGVGKTELAKTLAQYLFGSEKKMLFYSMSLFLGQEGVQNLLGRGVRNSWEEGRLIKEVSANPFSVILLDEIDQASTPIINALYQILDEGRIVDERGVETSFRATIIIATTNLGCEQFFKKRLEPGFKLKGSTEKIEENSVKMEIINTLRQHFGEPFLNRFSSIVIFNPLSPDAIGKIANANIKKVESLAGVKERGIKIRVSDELLRLLTNEGYSPTLGARAMERTVIKYVLNPVVSFLSENPQVKGKTLELFLENESVKVKEA